MTYIDLSHRVTLNLLRFLRAGSIGDSLLTDPGLMAQLRDSGLAIRQRGQWTTSSAADRLLDAVDDYGAQLLVEFEPCGYTQSHTSEWCGNPYCRSR